MLLSENIFTFRCGHSFSSRSLIRKDISQGLYHSYCFLWGYNLRVDAVNCWIEKDPSELSQNSQRITFMETPSWKWRRLAMAICPTRSIHPHPLSESQQVVGSTLTMPERQVMRMQCQLLSGSIVLPPKKFNNFFIYRIFIWKHHRFLSYQPASRSTEINIISLFLLAPSSPTIQGYLPLQQQQQIYILDSTPMITLNNSRTAAEIEAHLNQTLTQMADHQARGSYIDAQECRILADKLRKNYEERRVYELHQRHEQQQADLSKNFENELRELIIYWEKRIEQHNNEGEMLVRDMEFRHSSDLQSKRQELQAQLPIKVKESSECLNLRKMEEYMARQKNYVEAHNLQQKIAELVAEEKEKWMNNRAIKIDTALNTLKLKQDAELSNLKKKIRTGLDQLNKQRKKEEEKLTLKFQNIRREQKMQHEKEKIAEKGQFPSKGGQGSPMLTKTRLFSTRD